jgi:Protein of unknown function (DUF3551)
MEPNMRHFSLRNLSLASAALVLAAGAFVPAAPAAAAERAHATYCLSSDSENDCSFVSLAQCEATASGGLGECNRVATGLEPRGAYAFYRAHAAMRRGAR